MSACEWHRPQSVFHSLNDHLFLVLKAVAAELIDQPSRRHVQMASVLGDHDLVESSFDKRAVSTLRMHDCWNEACAVHSESKGAPVVRARDAEVEIGDIECLVCRTVDEMPFEGVLVLIGQFHSFGTG